MPGCGRLPVYPINLQKARYVHHSNTLLWLRAESKPFEKRTPLTPDGAAVLLALGVKVVVENSSERIYPDDAYEAVGCEMVATATWSDAPTDAFILGLKELPLECFPLKHNHIYFAHAFKGQEEAPQILDRLTEGSGTLLDLEQLTDVNGKRVASFGFWSGMAGASVSLLIWCQKMQGRTAPYTIPYYYSDASTLYNELSESFQTIDTKMSALVIGHRGRCGQGVQSLLARFQIEPVLWGRKETTGRDSFPEVLDHDLLFNCVFTDKKVSPFLTLEMLAKNTRLSIVNDISCDPTGPNNPLPVYNRITTFDNPTRKVGEGAGAVDFIAIDHLPTFFPKESSDDFSAQLLPYLRQLMQGPVWNRAEKVFDEAKGKNSHDSSLVARRKQALRKTNTSYALAR
jgi:saccharopine dehydrogenase (NAD+, L-lysine-forming)